MLRIKIKKGDIMVEWIKENKTKVVTIAGAVFALAAGLGSTLLSPEQREAIMTFITTIL